MDKYLKKPQNADNTVFFLTLQYAAKNNHNDERSKLARVHWWHLQPRKPQYVIFRRDRTGIRCCWSFFWLTSLMCPLRCDDHEGTFFFPCTDTTSDSKRAEGGWCQSRATCDVLPKYVRRATSVTSVRVRNTEGEFFKRKRKSKASLHTHTHTYCKVQLNAQFIRQTEPKNPEVKLRRREKEVGWKAKINRNKMCVCECVVCYDKVGFEREMKKGRISLGTEWCTANDVICSCCCW